MAKSTTRIAALVSTLLAGLLCIAAAARAAVPDGAELFAQHCAVCHGDSGHGGVGVPLALPAFLASVTDGYLTRTIRNGRPGRVMPAFRSLSDAEVHAIVAYVRSWSTVPAPHYSAAPVHGDPVHGRALFEKNCAVCHGADGRGGKGTGVTFSRPRNLPIIAPGLNNPGFLAAASDAMIRTTLMRGRAGTPMVSFLKKGLSQQDIDDLVSYVRAFEANYRKPAAPADAGPPVLVYDSPYSLKETVEAVEHAAEGRNFRLIRVQNLEYGLYPDAQQDTHQVIVYFCNFPFLDNALAIDPRVGLFLPCRVTVVERNGKVQVMAINPKRLSHLFNNAELDRACDQMYHTYKDILEEATL